MNPEESLEESKRETETMRPTLQDEYIEQLKENNQVLKDLIRNKNKEIISLEMNFK